MKTKKGYAVKHIPFLWRREEDLNLRYVSGVHTISKTEKYKKWGKITRFHAKNRPKRRLLLSF